MTAKTWFTILRGALLAAVAVGVIAFFGFENGAWLLLVVAVSGLMLVLGPNYFHPGSDD